MSVISARLAEKFEVSRATVSETIHRLMADGYAVQNDDKSVALTSAGRELTEKVLRRHRLAERLLFDLLGFDWIGAHEQAHALEHGMSDEVAQSISARLGHPLTCPHGNPIPGNASSGYTFLQEQRAFRLSEGHPGQEVTVVLISELVEDESEFLRRLSDTDIHPQAVLHVVDSAPASDFIFETAGQMRSIPSALARKIWVKNDQPGSVDGSLN
ncbi:MAG: hypothetical protein DLM70_16560 [Chloroflexi bacterium]|nr:MAG: hypothetical protein DLM70_16560 [Chloroflexota bacterium]